MNFIQKSDFRNIALYLLIFNVIFNPLAIGGVHYGTVAVSTIITIIALILLSIHRKEEGREIHVPYLFWIFFGSSVLFLLQALPLHQTFLHGISPAGYDIHFRSAEAAGNVNGGFYSISLNPKASLFEGLKMLGLSLFFLLATNLSIRSDRRKSLLQVLSYSGIFFMLIAIVQKISGTNRILFFYEPESSLYGFSLTFFSTFVNDNHFSEFLTITGFASLGAFVSSKGKNRKKIFLISFIASACGIAMSASRGGISSFFTFLVLYAAVLIFMKLDRHDRKKMIRASALSFGLLIIAGGYILFDRLPYFLNEIFGIEKIGEVKFAMMFENLKQYIMDFFITGSGKGAFGSVFTIYYPNNSDVTFTHVENLPLQMIVDMGVPAGIIVMGLILFFSIKIIQHALTKPRIIPVIIGLAAVILENMVDFGLEINGVAIPFMFMLGILQGLAVEIERDEIKPEKNVIYTERPVKFAVISIMLGFAVIVLIFSWFLRARSDQEHAINDSAVYLLDQSFRSGFDADFQHIPMREIMPAINIFEDISVPVLKTLILKEKIIDYTRYNPANCQIFKLGGHVLSKARVYNDALSFFERAGHLCPEDYSIMFSILSVHVRANNKSEIILTGKKILAKYHGRSNDIMQKFYSMGMDISLFADDSSPEVLESISNVLLNAGKPASAEKILLKSLGSKNNEYTAMHNLANLYFSMKKQQAAENYGFRMMTLYPEKTGGYEILSRIFILKGKHLEAAHLLFEVCKRNTENIDCLISLAKEQEITEDWSGYRETIAGFLQLINKSGRDDLLLIYYRLRAIMNYRNGNFTEALADINLALNKNSSDQASLRLGAQIYESLGNYIEAVNILEKLLNLNPSDSWAYQKSSELKVKIRTIIKK